MVPLSERPLQAQLGLPPGQGKLQPPQGFLEAESVPLAALVLSHQQPLELWKQNHDFASDTGPVRGLSFIPTWRWNFVLRN